MYSLVERVSKLRFNILYSLLNVLVYEVRKVHRIVPCLKFSVESSLRLASDWWPDELTQIWCNISLRTLTANLHGTNIWRCNLTTCIRTGNLNSRISWRLSYVICRSSKNTINKSNIIPAVLTFCCTPFETEKWRPSSKLYWCPRECGY
jgi:hypothetical protein